MAKFRESVISTCEKKFVIKNLNDYTRLDGRAFDEFRELKIEFGKDWGCCYVSLGKTRVLAQVSCEIQQPKSARPSEGILNINIELNQLGAPHFEPGRQSELSVQLNRLLEKGIKDSKAVDLESLCIKVKEKVWAFRVDINVLNHEGNILDCTSVAALAALAHFRRPDVTSDGEETIVHTYAQRDPIPTVIHHYPVCISYGIFNQSNFILADPTLLEEGVAEANLMVGLNAYKELCGLHLGGNALMTPEQILQCTNKAAARANSVVKQIKQVLEEDKNNRIQGKPIGFQHCSHFKEEAESMDSTFTLDLCLNQWKTKEPKKKNKQIKRWQKKMDVDVNPPGEVIESLGKGSAVLLPQEYGSPGNNAIAISSDEESEEDIDSSFAKVEKVEDAPNKNDSSKIINIDDDSEEECVIVLNADSQTNKQKRRKRTK